MNKITLSNIMSIMNEEILLANDFNIKNSRYKNLEFIPSELNYKVSLTDGELKTDHKFRDVQLAIIKYNSFDVDQETKCS